MYKPFLLSVLLVLAGILINAQSIKGVLADPVENVKVSGATVQLRKAKDSSLVSSMLSDNKGSFHFSGLSKGNYVIKASYVGFETLRQGFSITDSMPDVNLGTVYIPKKVVSMEGVTVVVQPPTAKQVADTTQFSASQFKVNPDATVEDLIKKMPGITVDKSGSVTAQGEQVKKVTVDGRDFFGDDATMAIKNLPAEVVDKIQVYDRLSEQAQLTGFDDGNSVKAINIVTRSNFRRGGQLARIFAGYGTDNRYAAGGNMSFLNNDRRLTLLGNFNNINVQNFATQDLLGVMGGGGGRGGGGGFGGFSGSSAGINHTNAFGIDYTNKFANKLTLSGSYFFNNSKNENETNSYKSTPLRNDSVLYRSSNSRSVSNNNNQRINMRLEYKIDSSNTLYMMPSISFQNNNSYSNSLVRSAYNTGDSSSYSNTNRNSHREGYNIGNNLMYRHSFRKRGRTLALSLQANYSKNDGYSYTLNDVINYELGTRSNRNQYSNNPTTSSTLGVRIAYTEPVGTNGLLELNYSPTLRKNKADQKTYDYDGTGYNILNIGQSNTFENAVLTNNAGLSYRLGKSRDNQLSFGVDLQNSKLASDRIYPTKTSVDQSFTTLLPNLRWMKKVGKYSNFRIFYRANTDFPSINQLQDVIDSSNLLNISAGNPALKQSFSNNVFGRYSYTNTKTNRLFFVNLAFQTTDNVVTTASWFNASQGVPVEFGTPKNGVTYTKPVNINGYRSFRSNVTYSQPIKIVKSNMNLSLGYNYTKSPGVFNNNKGFNVTNSYNGGLVLASNFSEYVDFTLGYDITYYNNVSNINMKGSRVKTNYINQSPTLRLNLLSKAGWFFNTDINGQMYRGLSVGYNQEFWLWNAAVGKKFLKKKQAELKLSAYDILKQNQSISRSFGTDGSFTDTYTKMLRQYFMLTFTYNLKNFGKAKSSSFGGDREHWRGDGPPGGGPPRDGGGRSGGGMPPMF